MAVDLDLSELSKKELEKLKAKVEQAIEHSVEKERKAALEAAEKAVQAFGFSLADLAPGGAAKAKAKKGKPKFRNPDDPSQTWTGKGRRPAWFIAAIDAGKSENDLSA